MHVMRATVAETPPGRTPHNDEADTRNAGGPEDRDRRPDKAAPNDKAPDGTRSADPNSQESTISDQEAVLRSLQGENADRLDAARSQQIVAERLRGLGQQDGLTISTLNLFTADVNVARDFTTGGAKQRRTAQRAGSGPVQVDSAHLADYTSTYVEPPGFPDALAMLEQHHLVVLAAPEGTGRDATALALLQRALTGGEAAEERPIFEVAASRALGNEAWTVPARTAGYLVTEPSAAGHGRGGATAADRIDDAWLTGVSTALGEVDSFLVVITGPLQGRLASATRSADFVVDDPGLPDPVEILKARVLAAASLDAAEPDPAELDPAELDRLLLEANAAAVLAERPWPRFAVRAAATVVEALKSGEDLATALERMRNPGEQVKEWFGFQPDLSQVAFAVATAVLENSSFLTVSDAAVDLYLALAQSSKAPSTLKFRRALAAEQPWIEITAPQQSPAGGSSPVPEAVRFRNPLLWRAVLAYTWTELDGVRPILLSWLQRLVGHPDVEARARAATAAAVLAAGDFQYALHRYLLPWANAESEILRQSTALTLGVIGSIPEHTSRVWALLRQWADELRLDTRRRLPTTAAMAAGGPLGDTDPQRGLRLLHTVLREGDWDLLEPVALSILHLVESGRTKEVIRALMEWTTQPNAKSETSTVKALVAYAFAVRQPAFGSPDDDDSDAAPDSPANWPVLLRDAHLFRDELPELWGRALGTTTVRPLALEALRDWMRVADDDGTAFPTVLDVVAGIADRGSRDLERLEYHLDRWARDEDDPSPAAGRIFDALTDAGAGAERETPWQM
jgi:hypothetical protein